MHTFSTIAQAIVRLPHRQLATHRQTLAPTVVLLLFSGCATVNPNATHTDGTSKIARAPDVVLAVPNVPLAEPYPITMLDATTQSDDATPALAAVRWQSFYHDEKLKRLIEIGLANNKNLEQAALAIERTAAQYQITRAQGLPNLGLSASYNRAGSSKSNKYNADSFNIGLGASSYELDFWGKVKSLKEQALQNYLATAAARDSVQISLIANIATAYTALSYAKAQLILAQSTVKSREHSLFITQQRFAAGIDSKAPSLQAKSSLENARLAVLDAQTNILKAQNALQLLIGAPIPADLSPEPAISSIVATDIFNAGLPSALLYYRPDVVQAEYQLKAAGANINVARAAFFPSISLSGNLGIASSSLSNLFKDGVSWSFGPSISLPIFDAGARRAHLDASVLEQQQAVANYEGTIATAFKEVNDVLADRATLDERLALQYALQSNHQNSFDIAYATFKAGLANYLDVLDAERSLFAVQQGILQMEQARVLSQIQLYQALGGGANVAPMPAVPTETARLATIDEVYILAPNLLSNPPAAAIPTASVSTIPAQLINGNTEGGAQPSTDNAVPSNPDLSEDADGDNANASNDTPDKAVTPPTIKQ